MLRLMDFKPPLCLIENGSVHSSLRSRFWSQCHSIISPTLHDLSSTYSGVKVLEELMDIMEENEDESEEEAEETTSAPPMPIIVLPSTDVKVRPSYAEFPSLVMFYRSIRDLVP